MAEKSDSERLSGPLTDVKVLEIGHYIAAPHCAMMLADQGADVIKLEPLGGEPGRHSPPLADDGESLAFACHNRGKRSAALDLRSPASGPALDALLRWADVVVTNYALGIPEKLGFGFERLQTINPRASMVHITGYGVDDPRRDYLAFDPAIQAMSGYASLNGPAGGDPLISPFFMADHSVAMNAAYAVMCALWEQRRTGTGRFVSVSMLESMTSQLSYHVPAAGVKGETPGRGSSRGMLEMFATRDAPMFILPGTPGMWEALCGLLGHPEWVPEAGKKLDLAADPALAVTVIKATRSWFAERGSKEAFAELQRAGIACGVARSVAQLYEEEVADATTAIAFVELAGGGSPVPVPGAAFRMARDGALPRRVAGLGADTRAILAGLGVDEQQVEAMLPPAQAMSA
ncbi:CaiB/BaiF CoA-transferase family protein [Sphingopyxis sp. DBS4]|uniref:CaiB/BaiF CoA transferase family protein n=1 Tax=Sphingopyxis sp. DBS4 TaxID=2968500 RepID=UPI00214CB2CA|nr:CoA transferase [Sphingopyxis sp. DBS4]